MSCFSRLLMPALDQVYPKDGCFHHATVVNPTQMNRCIPYMYGCSDPRQEVKTGLCERWDSLFTYQVHHKLEPLRIPRQDA